MKIVWTEWRYRRTRRVYPAMLTIRLANKIDKESFLKLKQHDTAGETGDDSDEEVKGIFFMLLMQNDAFSDRVIELTESNDDGESSDTSSSKKRT